MTFRSGHILTTAIEYLKGVGPQRGKLLQEELGISTFEDLLYHYPYRYFDRTKLTSIASVQSDSDMVQLTGVIMNISEEGTGRKKRLTATLYDASGSISLVWFQGVSWLKSQLRENSPYLVFGKASMFNGRMNMAHPEIEAITSETTVPGLQPVYSVTEKLRHKGISNRSFARLTQQLFEKLRATDIPEILPADMLSMHGLCSRYEALRYIHFPGNEVQLQQARHRLKWEELLLSQLKIAQLRLQRTAHPGYIFETVGELFNRFYKEYLSFELTGAQKRVLKEIRSDTATGQQMNRLVQGDVGSGKTIVALLSMLLAMDNGFQACMMAPTEILAQQHYRGIAEWLYPLQVPVAILTGSTKARERREILEGLSSGRIRLVVGTHALIEDTVRFKNLGLAVIDEQHRFGVGQRAGLWKKNEKPPHVMVMTATPIPRTLAMTLYGDLDVSVIDELPPGRQEIITAHRSEMQRAAVMQFIRSEIDKGRQAYIVYPLIEESEKIDYESLMAGYEQVRVWFPESRYRVAMVHGKQDAGERERNMQRFVQGEAQVLVATTVIEVGVNVPNASVMLIESAERFGLSQLHQLRGRVGRGAEQSYCILLTGSRISEDSRKRISVMTRTSDGFIIAEEDLALRGPGDLYGTRQSGMLKFKIADLVEDGAVLEQTRKAASELLQRDPALSLPDHRALRNTLLAGTSQGSWQHIS